MAFPFETEGVFLTQEQADHINERHVSRESCERASKFETNFSLVELLQTVSELTWDEDDTRVTLIDEGMRYGHGQFYLFAFKLDTIIGKDPEGFPAKHIAVYYSEKQSGEKWEIISCYPFTFAYHSFFKWRKHRSH